MIISSIVPNFINIEQILGFIFCLKIKVIRISAKCETSLYVQKQRPQLESRYSLLLWAIKQSQGRGYLFPESGSSTVKPVRELENPEFLQTLCM
jgi:hypothetical protein